MMAASDKLNLLLETLFERTNSGRAKWSAGSRGDTFIWSGRAASVVLLTKDNDGMTPWLVRLVDDEGRTVEEVEVGPNSELFGLVADLYSAARADALNINGTIDGLLGDLGF